MKKRKLNSTNPKYSTAKEEVIKEKRELIATIPFGKKRKVYAYAVFSEN